MAASKDYQIKINVAGDALSSLKELEAAAKSVSSATRSLTESLRSLSSAFNSNIQRSATASAASLSAFARSAEALKRSSGADATSQVKALSSALSALSRLDTSRTKAGIADLEASIARIKRSQPTTVFSQLRQSLVSLQSASSRVNLNNVYLSFRGILGSANSTALGVSASAGTIVSALSSINPVVGGVAAAFASSGAIVLSSLQQYAEFQRQIAEIQGVTGASSAALQGLETRIRAVAEASIYTATQVAEASTALIKAGLSMTQAQQALSDTVNFASSSGIGAEAATQILVQVSSAYHQSASEFGAIADIMNTSANTTTASIESLAVGLKYVTPLASALGIQFSELSSTLGMLHNAGLKGTKAATSLRQVLSVLADPTRKMDNFLSKMNARLRELGETEYKAFENGQFTGIQRLIVALEKAKMPTDELFKAFKKEGTTAISALLALGSEALFVSDQMVALSAGATDFLTAIKTQTLVGQFAILNSALEETKLKIGSLNSGKATDFLKDMIYSVKSTKDTLSEFVTSMTSVIESIYKTGKSVLSTVADFIALKDVTSVISSGLSTFAEGLSVIAAGYEQIAIASRDTASDNQSFAKGLDAIGSLAREAGDNLRALYIDISADTMSKAAAEEKLVVVQERLKSLREATKNPISIHFQNEGDAENIKELERQERFLIQIAELRDKQAAAELSSSKGTLASLHEQGKALAELQQALIVTKDKYGDLSKVPTQLMQKLEARAADLGVALDFEEIHKRLVAVYEAVQSRTAETAQNIDSRIVASAKTAIESTSAMTSAQLNAVQTYVNNVAAAVSEAVALESKRAAALGLNLSIQEKHLVAERAIAEVLKSAGFNQATESYKKMAEQIRVATGQLVENTHKTEQNSASVQKSSLVLESQLTPALSEARAKAKEATSAIESIASSLDSAGPAIKRAKAELNAHSRSLQKVEKSVKEMSKAYEESSKAAQDSATKISATLFSMYLDEAKTSETRISQRYYTNKALLLADQMYGAATKKINDEIAEARRASQNAIDGVNASASLSDEQKAARILQINTDLELKIRTIQLREIDALTAYNDQRKQIAESGAAGVQAIADRETQANDERLKKNEAYTKSLIDAKKSLEEQLVQAQQNGDQATAATLEAKLREIDAQIASLVEAEARIRQASKDLSTAASDSKSGALADTKAIDKSTIVDLERALQTTLDLDSASQNVKEAHQGIVDQLQRETETLNNEKTALERQVEIFDTAKEKANAFAESLRLISENGSAEMVTVFASTLTSGMIDAGNAGAAQLKAALAASGESSGAEFLENFTSGAEKAAPLLDRVSETINKAFAISKEAGKNADGTPITAEVTLTLAGQQMLQQEIAKIKNTKAEVVVTADTAPVAEKIAKVAEDAKKSNAQITVTASVENSSALTQASETVTTLKETTTQLNAATEVAAASTQNFAASMNDSKLSSDALIVNFNELIVKVQSAASAVSAVFVPSVNEAFSALSSTIKESLTSSLSTAGSEVKASLLDNFNEAAAAISSYQIELEGVSVSESALSDIDDRIRKYLSSQSYTINVYEKVVPARHSGGIVDFAALQNLPAFADGGYFRGVGGVDRNLVLLSDKEYVMPAGATQSIGVDKLDEMRATGKVSSDDSSGSAWYKITVAQDNTLSVQPKNGADVDSLLRAIRARKI